VGRLTEQEIELCKSLKRIISNVARRHDWPPEVIAGIISRESKFGILLDSNGKGDRGHGHGLMQIDDRSHAAFISKGTWRNAADNIEYGTAVLSDFHNYLESHTSLKGADLEAAAIASFNAGPGGVIKALPNWDAATTGKDYSSDVLVRAAALAPVFAGVDTMDTFKVVGHLLYKNGKQVPFRLSPDHGGFITPTLIVIHYTDTSELKSPLSWLTKKDDTEVSAHLIIDKNGEVYQLLPFNVRAYHAGVSEYDGRGSVNGFSIGIENVGTGDVWPDAQVEANRDVISALYDAYEIEDTVGHSSVSPGRKVDPGPNYPWDRVMTIPTETQPDPTKSAMVAGVGVIIAILRKWLGA